MKAPVSHLSASLVVCLLILMVGMPQRAIASHATADCNRVDATQIAHADDYVPENTGLPGRRSGGGTR